MSSDPILTCPVCGERQSSLFMKLYDDRYAFPGSFHLMLCHACGHKFLDCHFSDEQLQQLYFGYYPRAGFSTALYSPHREAAGFLAWLDGERRSAYCHVPAGVRVLDIGCGFCETLGYHEGRGCEAYGVEADANVQSVASEYGFRVHIGVFDPTLYPSSFFDYVTLDQVMEHLSDPLAAMMGVARVLKPGGVAVLSTPNSAGWGAGLFGRRWINWHAPYHQHFFSDRSLAIAAEKAGLQLEQMKTVTSSEWLFYQWNHFFLFPAVGEPSQFWSPLAKRKMATRCTYLLLKLIHLTKLNHIFTRFFDVLGLGDGRLYFLRKR